MRGTQNIKAFKAYLEGEQQFSVVDQCRMRSSIRSFRRAISLDSKFSRAHGYLSYALVRSALVGWKSRKVIAGEALEAVERAVKLDRKRYRRLKGKRTRDCEACDYAPYWDLAFVYLNLGKLNKAMQTYETALRLYDDFTDRLDRKPGLLAEAAVAFIQGGQRDRALELLAKSKLIPGWYRWNHGFASYMNHDYDAALAELTHPDLDPRRTAGVPPEVRLFLAGLLAKRGDINAARDVITLFLTERSGFTKDDAKQRWRFLDPDDQAHWDSGIDAAWP